MGIWWLYTAWWFQTFGLFSISYMGMSSSQLTSIFFRGVETTNQATWRTPLHNVASTDPKSWGSLRWNDDFCWQFWPILWGAVGIIHRYYHVNSQQKSGYKPITMVIYSLIAGTAPSSTQWVPFATLSFISNWPGVSSVQKKGHFGLAYI
jgi:hypothetical protein